MSFQVNIFDEEDIPLGTRATLTSAKHFAETEIKKTVDGEPMYSEDVAVDIINLQTGDVVATYENGSWEEY